MAGESHFGSNGSVWWTTAHYDQGRPASFKRQGHAGCQDGGVNRESDHWVDIGDRQRVEGHDPDAAEIFTVILRFDTLPTGSGSAAQAAPASVVAGPATMTNVSTVVDSTRVAAIQGYLQDLIRNAQTALTQISAGEPSATVEVTVPAIKRPVAPVDGFEVSVSW